MSEAEFVRAGDALETDIVQRTEEREERAREWAAGQSCDVLLVAERPEACDGHIPVVLGDGVAHIICPHNSADDCPHWGARWTYRRRKYLARLHFLPAHRDPVAAKIVPSLREVVRAYCTSINARITEGNGLSLGSAPGVGKTSIFALMAWAAREYDTLYVHADDLYGRLGRHWENAEYIGSAEQCDLLIIDDLGTESANDTARARFNRLMDLRTGTLRSTCIATNLVREQIAARPDLVRIIDRLRPLNPWVEATETESQRTEANWREWEDVSDE